MHAYLTCGAGGGVCMHAFNHSNITTGLWRAEPCCHGNSTYLRSRQACPLDAPEWEVADDLPGGVVRRRFQAACSLLRTCTRMLSTLRRCHGQIQERFMPRSSVSPVHAPCP